MKKIREFIKNLSPKKLIGFQFLYLSLAFGIAYTIANINPLVLYDNKTVEEWRRIEDVVEVSYRNDLTIWVGSSFSRSKITGMEVFNFSLFKNIMIYCLILNGICIGYWFLKRG